MDSMAGNQVARGNVQPVVKVVAVICMLCVVGLLGACGADDGDIVSSSPSDAAGDAPAADPSDDRPALMEACEPGARGWDGTPIAAFEDPANDGLVVCWADGHIPKSPPPGVDGAPPTPFDRVVFTATMDGEVVEMKQAGYRDRLPISAP